MSRLIWRNGEGENSWDEKRVLHLEDSGLLLFSLGRQDSIILDSRDREGNPGFTALGRIATLWWNISNIYSGGVLPNSVIQIQDKTSLFTDPRKDGSRKVVDPQGGTRNRGLS